MNVAAQELRVKANAKLATRAAAPGSAFLAHVSSLRTEASVRAVCRYLHFIVHRCDDQGALGLKKDDSAAVRCDLVCAHVEAMVAQLPASALPTLDGETWVLPVFVLG